MQTHKSHIHCPRVKTLAMLFVFFSFFTHKSDAAICVALATGNWTNPAVWSCGSVPNCGDSIVIPSGKTILITNQEDYTGCAQPLEITIYGTLSFQNGNKIKLPCGSKIYVYSGGDIESGGGGGNANNIEICSTVVWSAGDGTYTGPNCLPPGSCPGNLPVKISSFTATVAGTQVKILWSTAQEKNSSHFDVERSADALIFDKINTVNSKATGGNSYAPLSYTYLDESPFQGSSYYRLKQVDLDKSYEYSSVITVSVFKSNNIKFVIYPNPNLGEFTADISGIENNHYVKILLADQKGAIVYQSELYVQEATKINIVPEQRLAKGIYICTLMVEEIPFKVKVVVN
jgi:hypothetical protein